jgi:hypothetical protein
MPISVLNPNCEPMVCPILFPNGEKGWDEETKSEKQAIRNRITLLQFYSVIGALSGQVLLMIYSDRTQ